MPFVDLRTFLLGPYSWDKSEPYRPCLRLVGTKWVGTVSVGTFELIYLGKRSYSGKSRHFPLLYNDSTAPRIYSLTYTLWTFYVFFIFINKVLLIIIMIYYNWKGRLWSNKTFLFVQMSPASWRPAQDSDRVGKDPAKRLHRGPDRRQTESSPVT